MNHDNCTRNKPTASGHQPVLLSEVLDAMQISPSDRILDGTFGAGGYTRALLAKGANVLATDLDPTAADRAATISEEYPNQLTFSQGNFAEVDKHLAVAKWDALDGYVIDLGISSLQLDDPERGLAYRLDGPLDMRLGDTGQTAADILNGHDEKELADIFYYYGDETKSRQLAKLISIQRRKQKYVTTGDFLKTVEELHPHAKRGQRHPAQRLFQALRMAVNAELDSLEQALPAAANRLAKDGVLAVVSFHSAEDRLVKVFMRDAVKSGGFEFIHKKPVGPSDAEVAENPRARSGKLRAIRKLEAAA